jgi:hypothetical protein
MPMANAIGMPMSSSAVNTPNRMMMVMARAARPGQAAEWPGSCSR